MGAGPRCFSEHFPAFIESIAGKRDRLKKIRNFLGAARGATAEAAGFGRLLAASGSAWVNRLPAVDPAGVFDRQSGVGTRPGGRAERRINKCPAGCGRFSHGSRDIPGRSRSG